MCMCVCVCQFSVKTNSFDLFSPNLLKSGSRVGNSENYCQNKNQHPRSTICANLQSKWTALKFSAQICPKKNLGFETEKNNVGIRINIVQTICVPICSQTGQLWLFWSKFAQKMDLGSEIQNTKVAIRISIVKAPRVPILRKNAQLWLFRPKFSQKWILGLEFQKSKSGFEIYTSKIPCVPTFT